MNYQQAKARMNNPDALKPESLTRRGKILIARYFTPRWDKKVLQRMIATEIQNLFPQADISKVTVDRHYTTRAYFTI